MVNLGNGSSGLPVTSNVAVGIDTEKEFAATLFQKDPEMTVKSLDICQKKKLAKSRSAQVFQCQDRKTIGYNNFDEFHNSINFKLLCKMNLTPRKCTIRI